MVTVYVCACCSIRGFLLHSCLHIVYYSLIFTLHIFKEPINSVQPSTLILYHLNKKKMIIFHSKLLEIFLKSLSLILRPSNLLIQDAKQLGQKSLRGIGG